MQPPDADGGTFYAEANTTRSRRPRGPVPSRTMASYSGSFAMLQTTRTRSTRRGNRSRYPQRCMGRRYRNVCCTGKPHRLMSEMWHSRVFSSSRTEDAVDIFATDIFGCRWCCYPSWFGRVTARVCGRGSCSQKWRPTARAGSRSRCVNVWHWASGLLLAPAMGLDFED